MGACISAANQGSKSDTRDPKLFITDFNSPDDLKEHAKFFLANTNSALSRNLTHEIWEKYKDKKCDKGVPFRLCVFSGIKNQDAGMGIYAGSKDSYKQFKELFDRVIEEYHAYPPNGHHTTDMTYAGLKRHELPANEVSMINSVRVRILRNFENYPMCIGLSKA